MTKNEFQQRCESYLREEKRVFSRWAFATAVFLLVNVVLGRYFESVGMKWLSFTGVLLMMLVFIVLIPLTIRRSHRMLKSNGLICPFCSKQIGWRADAVLENGLCYHCSKKVIDT